MDGEMDEDLIFYMTSKVTNTLRELEALESQLDELLAEEGDSDGD